MKKFQIEFIGRKIHAIGIRYKIVETVDAPDIDKAILKLYDKYEHISIISVNKITD